ncbi:MAG: RDD family protein [Roseivirga sp.]|uniref:RDD family protein n=1 Tax=Roseivirga sp. TaxID=1964215 RepID=UPI001B0479C0|nr:RDD family protein [Roseivirga sp.]MBO6661646.1 RDD family protein [Roseivirga sp.]MBO6760600.1 RDD family protein [Roseivirga sp.]MBO6908369.1 RDD family protein [Roseivirga sp.]
MQISIQTTQNVTIEHDKAGVGNRVLAFMIDLAILILASMAIGYTMDQIGWSEKQWINILFYFPVFFYDLYMEILNNGQSVGKMIMNLRVVRLDGTAPTIGGFILRWILKPIDVMLSGSIAIISIALTQNGQRLGDLAASTTVVKLRKTEKVNRLQLVEKMEEDYQPQFPEVKALTDKEVNLIKDCLRMQADHTNSRPVLMMSEKVKQKLDIESDMRPTQFLYTILRDHTYYTTREQ